MKFTIYKIIFVLNLCFCSTLFAAQKQDKTRITSNVMDIKRKSQTIDFLGNVVVKNGADSMVAQKMTVFYEDDSKMPLNQQSSASKANKNEIKKIEAEKDVKVFSADFVASSDFGYYDPVANLFILEKNVIVNNGDSIGTGEKFIYNLTTRKGDFVGKAVATKPNEDRRVVVVIGSETKNKKSSSKKSD